MKNVIMAIQELEENYLKGSVENVTVMATLQHAIKMILNAM